jgi:hypothetical protein
MKIILDSQFATVTIIQIDNTSETKNLSKKDFLKLAYIICRFKPYYEKEKS